MDLYEHPAHILDVVVESQGPWLRRDAFVPLTRAERGDRRLKVLASELRVTWSIQIRLKWCHHRRVAGT